MVFYRLGIINRCLLSEKIACYTSAQGAEVIDSLGDDLAEEPDYHLACAFSADLDVKEAFACHLSLEIQVTLQKQQQDKANYKLDLSKTYDRVEWKFWKISAYASKSTTAPAQKVLNWLIILTMHCLWKERNKRV